MEKKKNNYKVYLFIGLIYILIFQNAFQEHFTILQYFDEILAIIAIPLGIIYLKKNTMKISKNIFNIFVLFLLLVIIGIIPIIIFEFQSFNVVIKDCLLLYKFFGVYLFSFLLFDYKFIKDNKKLIYKNVSLLINLFFILTILNYIFNIWASDRRFGIKVNQLMFGHSTYLAANCIFLMMLLILTGKQLKSRNFLFILLVLISTLRFKAIGAAISLTIVMLYILSKNKKIKIDKFILIAGILIIISFDQISYYFLNTEKSARRVLFMNSIEIMKDFFPCGTGFGTYGSYFSGKNYSPVYYLYNMYNIQGITPNDYSFVSDTFWPMIFGQFGVLGAIVYFIMLAIIYRNIQKEFDNKNLNFYAAKMGCFIYLIISSTSEAAFVNSIAISLALILGINKKYREIENEK